MLCVRTLAGIVAAPDSPPAARVMAANSLLDRGWGKAPVQLTGEEGGDIRIVIRQIIDVVPEAEPVLIEHDDGCDKD